MPPGLKAEPQVLGGNVAAKSRESYSVTITVEDRAQLPAGVQMVPFDITLDGKRYGELFDFVLLTNHEPSLRRD